MLHTQGKFNKKWYCKHTYVVQQQLFMKGGGEGMVIVSQRDVCNTGTPSGVSRDSSVSFFFNQVVYTSNSDFVKNMSRHFIIESYWN